MNRADRILDFRGSITSIALLKLTCVFSEMGPCEVVEILGSDPDMRQDLFRVLPQTSYDVIAMDDIEEEGAPCFRVWLRKRSESSRSHREDG